jgi:hypothetical protein
MPEECKHSSFKLGALFKLTPKDIIAIISKIAPIILNRFALIYTHEVLLKEMV